jgi:hypothetical protein
MPPKRPRKPALNAFIQTPPFIITLGEELQLDPLPITPLIKASNKHTLAPAESSYPLDPLFLSNDT